MSTEAEKKVTNFDELKDVAQKLRIYSVCATSAANAGHPTSCSSIAEIMSVLFFHVMRYDIKNPRDPSHDRVILSKGHAAPILYAAWAEAGLFPVSDLCNLRKVDSDLEGHPTPRLNFVDVGTGSLGQGLSVACGMSYVGKYYDKGSYRTYCILGDGESAEGSVWEALNFASHYKLDNLVAIFDINRLGQASPTLLQHDVNTYSKRIESFGFHTIVVDGHNIEELCKAFEEASTTEGKPTAIIAKTFKGKYFLDIEDALGWHGKALGSKTDAVIQNLRSLIKNSGPTNIQRPSPNELSTPSVTNTAIQLSASPSYTKDEKIATRLAYGDALVKIATNNARIISLDGDTKNSTFSIKLEKAFPDRYVECFIAEQNLVGVAIGAACRGRTIPFVSAFATFFTRAFDQIRMGAISQANVKFVGSHCGVSIGSDGPSQMGLEDLALFRSIPGSHVFYPSDAVSTERAVELAANIQGICFIRTSRPDFPILYSNEEEFAVGRAKVLRSSENDEVLIIGAGVTIHEAQDAADKLQSDHNIKVRVMDLFTIKPVDEQAIIKHAGQCGGRILTVEDHYPAGGLGEAVLSAVAENREVVLKKLAVTDIPHSGPGEVLLEKYGISAKSIVENVLKIVGKS